MEVNFDLLAYLVSKGTRHIEEAVEGTGYLPKTVIGLGVFLLDHDANLDLLTAKQQVTFDRFLRPLLFEVRCQGVTGPDSCRGTGLIEDELLPKCYRDDEFRCQACRDSLTSQG
jgi:hypothetical protein